MEGPAQLAAPRIMIDTTRSVRPSGVGCAARRGGSQRASPGWGRRPRRRAPRGQEQHDGGDGRAPLSRALPAHGVQSR
jgi:hypothetical protein